MFYISHNPVMGQAWKSDYKHNFNNAEIMLFIYYTCPLEYFYTAINFIYNGQNIQTSYLLRVNNKF